MENSEKPVAHLEEWSLVSNGAPYGAPELSRSSLAGVVYDHPRLDDDSKIITSSILRVDVEKGEVITHNTRYTLGAVDAGYERAFPNARDRLFGVTEQ